MLTSSASSRPVLPVSRMCLTRDLLRIKCLAIGRDRYVRVYEWVRREPGTKKWLVREKYHQIRQSRADGGPARASLTSHLPFSKPTMGRLLGRVVVAVTTALICFISYTPQIFVIWPWYGSELSIQLLNLLVPFKYGSCPKDSQRGKALTKLFAASS